MKTCAFLPSLFAICFFFTNAYAIDHYQAGDTLYVWAQSGLSLRTAPDFKAGKIALLPFGAQVLPQSAKYAYDNPDSMTTEAIPAATDRNGGKNPAYRIKGSWVKVRANGQEGYVFDGYLSALPPFDKNPALITSDTKGPNGGDQQVVIYKNGIYHQHILHEAGSISKYVLPDATLEEGFLVANQLFTIEKDYAKALQDKDGEVAVEFAADLLSFDLEYEAEGHYFMGSVTIHCVNNTVVIHCSSAH